MEKISPALTFQSEHYPASWFGKVPKRVRMATSVRPDFPFFLVEGKKNMVAQKGMEYEVYVNSQGAIAAILPEGELGLKPYEFEIIEWWHKKGGDEDAL